MIEYDTVPVGMEGGLWLLGLFKWRKTLYSDGEIELSMSPGGFLESGEGIQDGYTFDICLPDVRKPVGYISLRLGESPELYYLGHIGYRIHSEYRGHGYAGKALKLLIPLMRREGLSHPVITTDVGNAASRKTCLRAGCVLERVVPVPEKYRFVCSRSEYKCRYILCIPAEKERD